MSQTEKAHQCPYCGHNISWKKLYDTGSLLGETLDGFLKFLCPSCKNHLKYDSSLDCFIKKSESQYDSAESHDMPRKLLTIKNDRIEILWRKQMNIVVALLLGIVVTVAISVTVGWLYSLLNFWAYILIGIGILYMAVLKNKIFGEKGSRIITISIPFAEINRVELSNVCNIKIFQKIKQSEKIHYFLAKTEEAKEIESKIITAITPDSISSKNK